MKHPKPPRKVQVVIWARTQTGPKVLLFRVTRKRGGFWQPVTGACEPNESYHAAAAREAAEETGWSDLPTPVDLGYVHEFPIPPGKIERYEHGSSLITERAYAVELSGHRDPTLDPTEHATFAWCNPRDAVERCAFEPNREAIRRAVADAQGSGSGV